MIPPIKYLLNSFQSPLMRELHDSLDELEDVCGLIDRAITDDPPLVIKDGGIIKEGYNEEIDRLRKAKTEGKQWLSELEAREREKTGIKNRGLNTIRSSCLLSGGAPIPTKIWYRTII